MSQNPIDPLLLTIAEAAATLRVGRSTVYRIVDAGELPTVHIGRAVRIPAAALARYVDERTAAGGLSPPGNTNGVDRNQTPFRGKAA